MDRVKKNKQSNKYLLFFILTFVIIFNFPTYTYGNADVVKAILFTFKNTVSLKNIKNFIGKNTLNRYRNIKKLRYSAARNIRKYNLKVVNRKYSGKIYPLKNLPYNLRKKYPNSVKFDRNGYPDFKPYAIKIVRSEDLTGKYYNDFSIANKISGYNSTPVNYTWHHHQNGKDMLLIPKDLHNNIRHSGGHSYLINTN